MLLLLRHAPVSAQGRRLLFKGVFCILLARGSIKECIQGAEPLVPPLVCLLGVLKQVTP